MKRINIGEKILNTIKKGHIEPKPKWQFLLKEYFVWLVGAISLMIGSLAFAVVIYMILESDWGLYEHISGSLLNFVFTVIPYFWVVFLILFVIIADYNFKHTKEGYKYRVHWVILGSIILSMVFGSFLYIIGLGQAIDDVFAEKVPSYEKMFNKAALKARVWTNPKKGLLMGVIVSVEDEENFVVMDLNKNEWIVTSEGAIIHDGIRIIKDSGLRMVGERVKIVGDVSKDKNIFKAKKLMTIPKMCSHFNKECPMQKRIENLIKNRKILPPKHEIEKINCKNHNDCELGSDYAIRSSCPFIARCIKEECKTVCEEPYPWMEVENGGCQKNNDCDCKHYIAEDLKGCACVDGRCGAIVAE